MVGTWALLLASGASASVVDAAPLELATICETPAHCASCATATIDSPLWVRSVHAHLAERVHSPRLSGLVEALPTTTPKLWRQELAGVATGLGRTDCALTAGPVVPEAVPHREPVELPRVPTVDRGVAHDPIEDELRDGALRAVLAVRDELAACHHDHSSHLEGTLLVTLTLAADAPRTLALEPPHDTLPPAPRRCLEDAFDAAPFIGPRHGDIQYAFPITFAPPAGAP